MKKYKFYLVKAVAWYPRFKRVKKNVVIEARDLQEARVKIETDFPSYDVSMFWPV